MDKELLLKLVDTIESVSLENMVYRAMFKTYQASLPSQAVIEEMLEVAKNDPLVGGRVRAQFEPLRAHILSSCELAIALHVLAPCRLSVTKRQMAADKRNAEAASLCRLGSEAQSSPCSLYLSEPVCDTSSAGNKAPALTTVL